MDEYISRQAALDMVNHLTEIYVNNLPPMLDKADVYDNLRLLPSADVRLGRWNCGDDIFEYAVCSYCKWDSGEAWEYAKKHFKYCPNCGADMRGERNDRT